MAVLVTRPAPDNERTAEALRLRKYRAVLAPMLRFEQLACVIDAPEAYSGIIFTSANAVRAAKHHPAALALQDLEVFAVGAHTAAAARAAGFARVVSADGDSAQLRALIVKTRTPRARAAPLLYFAGEAVSRDLARELESGGIAVVRAVAYRMRAERHLPEAALAALTRGEIAAVLHYSAHSARAFVDAVRAEGLEISALSLPHGCLSAAVATVLREAGAVRLIVAERPDEASLLDAMQRAIPHD